MSFLLFLRSSSLRSCLPHTPDTLYQHAPVRDANGGVRDGGKKDPRRNQKTERFRMPHTGLSPIWGGFFVLLARFCLGGATPATRHEHRMLEPSACSSIPHTLFAGGKRGEKVMGRRWTVGGRILGVLTTDDSVRGGGGWLGAGACQALLPPPLPPPPPPPALFRPSARNDLNHASPSHTPLSLTTPLFCLQLSLLTGHCQLTQNRLTRVQSLLTRKPSPHSSPQP